MPLVQSGGDAFSAGGTTFDLVPFANPVTEFNCLVAFAISFQEIPAATITSPGASWSKIKTITCTDAADGIGGTLDVWIANNIVATTNSNHLSVTYGSSVVGGNNGVFVSEWSGVAVATALDSYAFNENQTSTSSGFFSPTLAITNNDLVLSIMLAENPGTNTYSLGFSTIPGYDSFVADFEAGISTAVYGKFPAGNVQNNSAALSGFHFSSIILGLLPLPSQPLYNKIVPLGATTLNYTPVGSPDSFELRDLYGNTQASGSVSGSFVNVAPSGGFGPGWTIATFTKSGTAVDSAQFSCFRSGIGTFPSTPGAGTAPNAGTAAAGIGDGNSGSVDSTLHGLDAQGFQRYQIGDASNPTTGSPSIANDAAEIAYEQGAAGYLNPAYADAARPRTSFIQFPNQQCIDNTKNGYAAEAGYVAGVTATALALGPGTPSNNAPFEGFNEPSEDGLSAAQSGALYNIFRTALKAGNANALAMGPCEVSTCPIGANSDFDPDLSYFEAFLAAVDDLDICSQHLYNGYNGDWNVTDAWLGGIQTALTNAGYGSVPIYLTELGNIRTSFAGVFDPRRLVQWAASLYITCERWGIPKEHIFWYYDRWIGFDSLQSWIVEEDTGMRPTAVFFRVRSEQLWGKTYSSALNFGTLADRFYRGNVYRGTDGTMVELLAQGNPSDIVTLAVSDTGTVTCCDWEGNTFTTPVTGGLITIPISDLPTYVGLSSDCTVLPVDVGNGVLVGSPTNLALTATATSGSGAASPSLINNGLFETEGYLTSPDAVFNSTTVPDNVVLTWAAAQTFDKVILRFVPPWAEYPSSGLTAMVSGNLEYWSGGAWVACPTVATNHWNSAGGYDGSVYDSAGGYDSADAFDNTTAASFLGIIQGNTNGGSPETSQWVFTFWDCQWNHNISFSSPVTTTKLRLTISATSYGNVPDEFGAENANYSYIDSRPQQIWISEFLVLNALSISTTLYAFTPPTANIIPPFLPETRGAAWGLTKYMAPRAAGVIVYKLSDGTYVQDYSTAENRDTNVPPYPLSADNGTGTPNIIDVTYTSASPGNPSRRIETDINPYVVFVYYGGRTYTVSSTEAAALTAYTAHGTGYGDCLVEL